MHTGLRVKGVLVDPVANNVFGIISVDWEWGLRE